jgi:dihydroorotate dehydrogenase (NAD+) catalytic subunit
MNASGTLQYGKKLNISGVNITKGVSLLPILGNPSPRMCETSGGALNSIGLENSGIEVFIKEQLPEWLKNGDVIVNIFGKNLDEFGCLAEILNDQPIAGIEVNISCPNVKQGGIAFGVDPKMAGEVTKVVVRNAPNKFIIVKLSPNVTDIVRIAKSVEEAGADSISLINTLVGMDIDIEACRPKLANIIGGYSGRPIFPVALRMVWQICQPGGVRIPVIAVGGADCYESFLKFMIAGASAVQCGTALFKNKKLFDDFFVGVSAYMQRHGIRHISEIIGTLKNEKHLII